MKSFSPKRIIFPGFFFNDFSWGLMSIFSIYLLALAFDEYSKITVSKRSFCLCGEEKPQRKCETAAGNVNEIIQRDEGEGEQGIQIACRLGAGNSRKVVSVLILLTFLLEWMCHCFFTVLLLFWIAPEFNPLKFSGKKKAKFCCDITPEITCI